MSFLTTETGRAANLVSPPGGRQEGLEGPGLLVVELVLVVVVFEEVVLVRVALEGVELVLQLGLEVVEVEETTLLAAALLLAHGVPGEQVGEEAVVSVDLGRVVAVPVRGLLEQVVLGLLLSACVTGFVFVHERAADRVPVLAHG